MSLDDNREMREHASYLYKTKTFGSLMSGWFEADWTMIMICNRKYLYLPYVFRKEIKCKQSCLEISKIEDGVMVFVRRGTVAI